MPRPSCHRKGCGRTRSELSMLLSRKHVPQFRGEYFCGLSCLEMHVEAELAGAWRILQQEHARRIPRPRLGSILLQHSFVTREQLQEAVARQVQSRQGRIGEWLVRLGFVDEHQVTIALSKQCGLPMLNLKEAEGPREAAAMIPGKVARSARVLAVGYDEKKDAVLLAVSDPVSSAFQEAIRRMLGRRVNSYIADGSAIEALIQRSYDPEELDWSGTEHLAGVEELPAVARSIARRSAEWNAENIEAELLDSCLWVRFEGQGRHENLIYGAATTVLPPPACAAAGRLALASGA